MIEVVVVKGPFAEISTNFEGGCLEKEVELTIKGDPSLSYSWDFTDGQIEETKDLKIKHTFKNPGIYKPRLLLKDASGCKGSAYLDHPIVVDKLDIKMNPSTEKICDAGPLTFAPVFNSYSIDELGKPGTYTWTYDPALTATDPTTPTPKFQLDKKGSYTFTLKAVTVYGCEQTVSAVVNVYTKPVAAITGPDKGCQDAPLQFSGAATKEPATTWKWNFGNSQTDDQQQPKPQSFNKPGIFNIGLTVTSKDGCTDEVHHAVNILPLPDIKASAPSEFICLHNTTMLYAGGGSHYEWTPATGLDNPLIATPLASPEVTTTYKVKVTDDNGCVNTDAVKIRVVQPFTVYATPDTVLCLGDKLPLRAWGTDYYKWEGTGINDPNKASPVATITSTSQYTYKVTGYDKEGCFSDNKTLTVRVNPRPTVNIGPDRESMAGIPLYLTSVTSNDVISWTWTPPQDLGCFTCPMTEALPNISTRYVLEVANGYGCKKTDDMFVHIICRESAVFMPNAFTPNNDGKNERIYPKGKGVKEIGWLRIYDRWGTLVYERTRFPINMPAVGWDGRSRGKEAPAGTYIYSMQTVCESGEHFEFKGNITLIR
ncbi:PKD domain-containing protein [Chitinophaga sp. PC14]|uniref:PKD domain-containing protein n=1 Tax=Chitinophaga nivalis TaxID=2991709 RepID=A0ABT3IIB4_9BACT|nr:PKD domain-containing protein [Chitinophaga nivalis]